jgi:hypothetical protein
MFVRKASGKVFRSAEVMSGNEKLFADPLQKNVSKTLSNLSGGKFPSEVIGPINGFFKKSDFELLLFLKSDFSSALKYEYSVHSQRYML